MNARPLLELIHDWHPRLAALTEGDAQMIVGSKWNRKELLGHLLDSALNNHQRIVRLQQGNLDAFPGYDQEHWVIAGGYQDSDWSQLVTLWHLFNLQLARVIQNAPASVAGNLWIGHDADLSFLILDYNRHLLHHLEKMHC